MQFASALNVDGTVVAVDCNLVGGIAVVSELFLL